MSFISEFHNQILSKLQSVFEIVSAEDYGRINIENTTAEEVAAAMGLTHSLWNSLEKGDIKYVSGFSPVEYVYKNGLIITDCEKIEMVSVYHSRHFLVDGNNAEQAEFVGMVDGMAEFEF